MPLALVALTLTEPGTGLVVVDEVNGFVTVGAGNLAPPVEEPRVTHHMDLYFIASRGARVAERIEPA